MGETMRDDCLLRIVDGDVDVDHTSNPRIVHIER